jgi:hypothetical protein
MKSSKVERALRMLDQWQKDLPNCSAKQLKQSFEGLQKLSGLVVAELGRQLNEAKRRERPSLPE